MDEVLRKNFYSIIAHPQSFGACFPTKRKQAPQVLFLCRFENFLCHLRKGVKRIL